MYNIYKCIYELNIIYLSLHNILLNIYISYIITIYNMLLFNSNNCIYHITIFFLIKLVIFCICLFISGVPQPDIVWYKDAVPISPVKTPRYRVLAGGSLQVNGLLPDDTGMFQCFARNQAGEVQTNTYLAVTSEFILPSLSPGLHL